MPDDDVMLSDLEVITRWSLAVRGPRARRSELIAALQADLDWLQEAKGTDADADADAGDASPSPERQSPAVRVRPRLDPGSTRSAPYRPAPRIRVARRPQR